VYRNLEHRLGQHVREYLLRAYGVELPKIVIEQPPRVELGEYALPLAFELAKKLRKPPRKIAEEIVSGIGPIEGFEKFELAGAGYINARLKREELAAALTSDERPQVEAPAGKVLVEHSSINPNKAAHIGHLRNAILGDTFVRLLRFAGREVDVQNYIDNTGVQVADVIVGFMHLEKTSRAQIEELTLQPRFDYYCWDVYARASQWYGQDKQNLQARHQVLHAIEEGGNETAAIAELISVAVLRRHLETMDRLDIEYDFLPRESEILHLHFWDAAFVKLKDSGVLFLENAGKNKGCWVMRRAGTAKSEDAGKDKSENAKDAKEGDAKDAKDSDAKDEKEGDAKDAKEGDAKDAKDSDAKDAETGSDEATVNGGDAAENDDRLTAIPLRPGVDINPEGKIAEEDQKVIVRSNGTVGYVGKDIAYHLWKFGLLGRDFGYRKFYGYPNGHDCWISTTNGEASHPHFGDVAEIYNVIDTRQAEAQNTVIEALRELGHAEQANHYTHFSYEMVALTPRCAGELGYELSEEDKARSFIEVSGRKGFGVKADDLIDTLIASAQKEVDARHPELSETERSAIARQIAIGALRYFMLKFTKSSVIAFDFEEALSFEGETGPYAQYAVVRATNIFRKGGFDIERFSKDVSELSGDELAKHLTSDDLWGLWLASSKTSYVIEQCIATTEPAYLAKHVFQLAQLFNTFYHRYPILTEPDESRKKFLLATAAVVRRELIRALAVMGIEVPSVM
jgi:arginyl-tRNA synthetase